MKKMLLTPISIPQRLLRARYGTFALGMLCVIGTNELCHAQGTLDVNATISAVQSGGTYDYSLTVNNAGDSVAFGTFWYAWVPGAFEMSAVPSSVTPAAGWTFSTPSGNPGTSSIEFNNTTPLDPGSSATFAFVSTETPSEMFATGPGTPDQSFVYTGSTAFSGSSEQVSVSPVPEPSSIALMLTGLTGAWFTRRKR
jgi:hypothetical protein